MHHVLQVFYVTWFQIQMTSQRGNLCSDGADQSFQFQNVVVRDKISLQLLKNVFLHSQMILMWQTPISERRLSNRSDLANATSAKLEEGSARAAVRLLCSDKTSAMPSLESLAKLQDKHPPTAEDRLQLLQPESFSPLAVSESDVLNAVSSFPAGSSGGPDGFRPQHLVISSIAQKLVLN